MLPTIDISLIGIILAVWNVIKIIWDYTSKALNWITQRALALIIGSKFWATAAFLVAAGVLISVISTIIDRVLNLLFEYAFPSINLPNQLIDTVGFFISEDILEVFTFALSCWLSYEVIVGLDFSRRIFQRLFTILSQAWKT